MIILKMGGGCTATVSLQSTFSLLGCCIPPSPGVTRVRGAHVGSVKPHGQAEAYVLKPALHGEGDQQTPGKLPMQ